MMKYPRTPHLEGSRLQPGDEDLEAVPFSALKGRHVVVEEKVDGANAGLSFDEAGRLRLQSRGHYLSGGPRERHFALFKTWAARWAGALHERLGARYLVFGEWLHARHTVFYDALPHHFLEFDVYDREAALFLSTPRRRRLLDGLPLVSVPVLHEGVLDPPEALPGLVGRSLYKSARWQERLGEVARAEGLDEERAREETDPSSDAEGLYLKIEEEGRVAARFKWIRASFLTAVTSSGSHWLNRPLFPNQLAEGVDLFGGGAGS